MPSERRCSAFQTAVELELVYRQARGETRTLLWEQVLDMDVAAYWAKQLKARPSRHQQEAA